MKKPLLFFSVLITLACIPSSPAALLLYDGFDYSAGALVPGNNGGVGFTSAWQNSGTGGTQVSYPGLTYTDGNSNSLAVAGGSTSVSGAATQGAYRDFSTISAAADATTTYWLSFIGLTSGAPYGTSGDEASIQLRLDNTNLVSVGAFGSSDSWRVRVSGGVGGTLFTTVTGVPSSSTEAFVVVRIDINTAVGGNDAVHFWLNPDLDEEPSLESAAASLSGTNIWDTFSLNRLRTGLVNSTTEESKGLVYDEFRFGTTYAAVAPIPEPGTLALLGLFGLFWAGRRR